MKLPPNTCDCGQPGVRHDGSGWSCASCVVMLKNVTELLARVIAQQRGENAEKPKPDRSAYDRAYNWTNREKRRAYHRERRRQTRMRA